MLLKCANRKGHHGLTNTSFLPNPDSLVSISSSYKRGKFITRRKALFLRLLAISWELIASAWAQFELPRAWHGVQKHRRCDFGRLQWQPAHPDGQGQGCEQPRQEFCARFRVSGCHLEDYRRPCALCGFFHGGKVLFHLSQALQGARSIWWAPGSFAPVGTKVLKAQAGRAGGTMQKDAEPPVAPGWDPGAPPHLMMSPRWRLTLSFPSWSSIRPQRTTSNIWKSIHVAEGDPELALSGLISCGSVFAGCWFRATKSREWGLWMMQEGASPPLWTCCWGVLAVSPAAEMTLGFPPGGGSPILHSLSFLWQFSVQNHLSANTALSLAFSWYQNHQETFSEQALGEWLWWDAQSSGGWDTTLQRSLGVVIIPATPGFVFAMAGGTFEVLETKAEASGSAGTLPVCLVCRQITSWYLSALFPDSLCPLEFRTTNPEFGCLLVFLSVGFFLHYPLLVSGGRILWIQRDRKNWITFKIYF